MCETGFSALGWCTVSLKKDKIGTYTWRIGGGRVAIRETITNEIIFKVENVCFVDKRLTQMM